MALHKGGSYIVEFLIRVKGIFVSHLTRTRPHEGVFVASRLARTHEGLGNKVF